MYHYLEHTIEPKKELAAAATALPPGGHLAIELPDPSPAGPAAGPVVAPVACSRST